MTEPTSNFSYQGESNLFHTQPTTIVYASFWERLGAYIIDYIITWVISFFIQMAFGITTLSNGFIQSEGFESPENSGVIALAMGYLVTILAMYWLYYAIMHSSNWQATLGKRALGIKVTDMNGERISFSKATGRFFATFLSTIILLIGYLMMLWDDQKQTLHDKLAGTLVVKGK